jgi:hypothetical protein
VVSLTAARCAQRFDPASACSGAGTKSVTHATKKSRATRNAPSSPADRDLRFERYLATLTVVVRTSDEPSRRNAVFAVAVRDALGEKSATFVTPRNREVFLGYVRLGRTMCDVHPRREYQSSAARQDR